LLNVVVTDAVDTDAVDTDAVDAAAATVGSIPLGWQELSFEIPLEAVEVWSDALLEAGALSVDAQDADADSIDEVPLYGEPGLTPPAPGWERTRLTVLMVADCDPLAVVNDVADAIGSPPPGGIDIRWVAEQDWVRLTQSQFEPIPIGERLLITPSWHAEAAQAANNRGRLCIELDPGLAFGTGSHPTTRLCLEWLEQNLGGGESVIDYGCGSGILAIAAARLGAKSVIAIDIDTQALISTQANAKANPPTDQLIEIRSTEDPRPEAVDVVVANILSMPLKLLAPVLIELVEAGGALVLSGVLQRQAEEVASAYAPRIPLTVVAERDGWVCLAGRRSFSSNSTETQRP
jgi:ribosomal protein L11 methyltransferase